MLVKCKICGTKNEKSDSYCVVINNKNNYYCSKQEYDRHKAELEYKDLFYKELCECFGYEIKNSMLWKEMASLKELYSYEVLYHTLVEKKSDVVKALPNLARATEINKIKYTFAIVGNYVKATEEKLRRLTSLKTKSDAYMLNDKYEEDRFLNKVHFTNSKPKKKCLMDFINEYEGDFE